MTTSRRGHDVPRVATLVVLRAKLPRRWLPFRFVESENSNGLVGRHYVATCVSVELPRLRIQLGEKPASAFSVSVDLGRFRLGLKGTLDLLIGVRIPASQLTKRLNQIPDFPFACARTESR